MFPRLQAGTTHEYRQQAGHGKEFNYVVLERGRDATLERLVGSASRPLSQDSVSVVLDLMADVPGVPTALAGELHIRIRRERRVVTTAEWLTASSSDERRGHVLPRHSFAVPAPGALERHRSSGPRNAGCSPSWVLAGDLLDPNPVALKSFFTTFFLVAGIARLWRPFTSSES